MKDRPEDAATVLHKLHNEEEATIELEQIRNQIAIDSRLDSSWRRIATKPSYRKRAIIAVILASSTQMVGALVINSKLAFSLFPSASMALAADENVRLRPLHLWRSSLR